MKELPISEEMAEILSLSTAPSEVHLGVLRASKPVELLAVATEMANALSGVIESKKLFSTISGRRYVRCEGWTTLATMLGCLPREDSVTRLEDGAYEATVSLVRMADGAVLTRASSECGREEPLWQARPSYARRSMAITRGTGKACRIAFSWIMVLAGYEPTPHEEMPVEASGDTQEAGSPLYPPREPDGDLSPLLEASIAKAKEAKLSPGVREMLDKARQNRETAAAELGKSSEVCNKCGAKIGTFTAKAGHGFEQCLSARYSQDIYAEGGHHYRRLKP